VELGSDRASKQTRDDVIVIGAVGCERCHMPRVIQNEFVLQHESLFVLFPPWGFSSFSFLPNGPVCLSVKKRSSWTVWIRDAMAWHRSVVKVWLSFPFYPRCDRR
jgi:hypothetical protein